MTRSVRLVLVAIALFAGPSCRKPAPEPTAVPPVVEMSNAIQFEDLYAPSDIGFRHRSGAEGKLFMSEVLGAGAAAFDCDADGDMDLLLRQGGVLPGGERVEVETDRLYRNDGTGGPDGVWRFVDVTNGSGLDRPGYGMGVATGDFDQDGRVDLYLTNLGPNRMLRAIGGCRYEDVTESSGTGDDRWSTAASFLDIDADGDLDLFVGNYVRYDRSNHKSCFQASGAPDYCGPDSFAALPPRLLRNRGDGTFEDITLLSGFGARPGKTLGSIAADFDGDRRVDLFVANDSTDNFLWRNLGEGKFEETAKILGVALNATGVRTGDMGVDAADFDGDADLDLVSTHLAVEGASLWRNDGRGGFWDSAAATGALAGTLGLTGFGARWIDPDLDASLDLFVANGGVRFIDRLAKSGPSRTLDQPNVLLRWSGGRYRDVLAAAGSGLATPGVFRAVAVADFDDDGDPDLVVTRNDGPPQLLRNRSSVTSDWIGLRLVGKTGRSDALGAEARLTLASGRVILRRVQTDGSYLAAGDPRIVFGLVGAPEATRLSVRWPDGTEEEFTPPARGSYVELRQGEGRSAETAATAASGESKSS